MQYNYKYKIIKSNRQSISVTVLLNNEVIVRAPKSFVKQQIDNFMMQKDAWIKKIIKNNNKFRIKPLEIIQGEKIHYLGQVLCLKLITDSSKKKLSIMLEGSSLKIVGSKENMLPDIVKKELKKWFVNRAKDIIIDRVHVHAENMNLSYNQVRIKTLKSRWGSCSNLKNLNFNWVLMMCPMAVLDYVVIHELAHLVHMNHSSKFWDLVEDYCPDYKKHIEWLKVNQGIIYLF